MTRASIDENSPEPLAKRQQPWFSLAEERRAERLGSRLTLQQLGAIARDTRLPGEIASTYGASAAVILRIQRTVRRKAALISALFGEQLRADRGT